MLATIELKKARAKLVTIMHDARSAAELAGFYASQWAPGGEKQYAEIATKLTEIIATLKTL